jgi:hypothetical protein
VPNDRSGPALSKFARLWLACGNSSVSHRQQAKVFHPSHTSTGKNCEDRMVPPEFDALPRWRYDALAANEFQDKWPTANSFDLSRSR